MKISLIVRVTGFLALILMLAVWATILNSPAPAQADALFSSSLSTTSSSTSSSSTSSSSSAPVYPRMTLTGPSGTYPNQQSFTFTAYVANGTAQLSGAKKAALVPMQAPTGTVSFYDNGVLIPACAQVQLNASGVATCTVTLGLGTHKITATYNGDTIFSAVTAAQTLTITVSVPAEVPEGDTLLLLGGGMGSLGMWLRYQWSKRKGVSS